MLSEAEPAFARELLEQREMKRGFLAQRRNAHQADDRQAQCVPAMADEGDRILGRDAGLLRFLAGVHLDEKLQRLGRFCQLRLQGLGEFLPVQRMDGVEQFHRLAHFVGLQRADEMQLNAGKARAQFRPFRFGFLHPIFAEQAVTGFEDGRMRSGPCPLVTAMRRVSPAGAIAAFRAASMRARTALRFSAGLADMAEGAEVT